jgi:hypothetical protein
MTHHRVPRVLTLLSLSTLILGAVGCSNRQSPTEPAALENPVAAQSVVSSSQNKRHDADDPAGDDRGGRQARGTDDPAGDDHGGRQARGTDDPAGDDHGGRQGGQQRPPRAGNEVEGVVAAVDTAAGTLTLAGGKRIAVNAQTQWNPRGDLLSLSQVAAAVAAGKPTRAEAHGTPRADGALLAQTIKAEVGRR